MRVYKKLFERIIEPENLFLAWNEFKKGKGKKLDVMFLEKNLEQHIFKLHRDLRDDVYTHGGYTSFYISDPKLRHIHKATVRDRILHHAVFRILNPIFEPTYIHHSFSCRVGKGNHKGVEALDTMLRQMSRNNTKKCFALKCDVRKFFDSIDHEILLALLNQKIKDTKTTDLLRKIIESYFTRERERERGDRASKKSVRCGIPIGNLTSQLFANVYMNVFDQFVRHNLKVKKYVRYTDDFIIVSESREYLERLLVPIQLFLKEKLELELHPSKVSIRKYREGIDFLGYVLLPYHTTVRTKTRKRMMRRLRGKIEQYKDGVITQSTLIASFQSYMGVLFHADTHYFRQDSTNDFWFHLHD